MKDNLIISYLTLRKLIGSLGLLLSPLCIMIVLLGTGSVEQSISAYYYTVMRDPIVATLTITGAFLLTYKGYDLKDNIVTSISGGSIIIVAIVPSAFPIIHGISAVVFFLSIAYMSYFQFTQGSRNNKVYRACGIIILVSMMSWGLAYILHIKYSTLIIETIMMSVFGITWLIKGKYILK